MVTRFRGLVIVVNLTYALILLLIGLSPEIPDIAKNFSDRAAHATASAIHAALLVALLRGSTHAGSSALLAAAGATLYGGLIEMLQMTQPTRTFEAADLAANAIGACSMALVIFLATQPSAKGRER